MYVTVIIFRYKKILDYKGDRKSGRGGKSWEFFKKMDDVCGGSASSVSLRAVTQKVRFRPPPSTVSTADTTSQTTSGSTIQSCSTSQQQTSLIRPSSDTDSDDVIETGSVRATGTSQIKKRKIRQSKAPEWFVEAERRMQDWREDLKKRMDRQEQLQQERTDVLKQTNELLKALINSCSREQ